MDLLPEICQFSRADDTGPQRIDGKGMRMQLDVHCLAIPDVKLIRTAIFRRERILLRDVPTSGLCRARSR